MAEFMDTQGENPNRETKNIVFKEAGSQELPLIEEFLSRKDIDSLFVPPLSDPVRGMSIKERVDKKFKEGVWIIAIRESKAVGCLAIVPSELPLDVPSPEPEKGSKKSEGVSLQGWSVEKLVELSTMVTDPTTRVLLGIKGIGAKLLEDAKEWVQKKGNGRWGFITDSWVGSDMDGFITHLNTRAYNAWLRTNDNEGKNKLFDTLIRIYSDPSKRGIEGLPTVVYGIPITDHDWEFFSSKQKEISALREAYNQLKETYSK